MRFDLRKEFNIAIDVPESKSVGHRDLIVNFLIDVAQDMVCNSVTYPISCMDSDSNDIKATKCCINALAAATNSENTEIILPADESGSTLRFFIPVGLVFLDRLGKLDKVTLVFTTKGRLFERPLDDIEQCLKPHGVTIIHDDNTRAIKVKCSQKHLHNVYRISGKLSSQNISGLLMALPLLKNDSQIHIIEEFNSKSYVGLTTDVLRRHNVDIREDEMLYEVKQDSYKSASHVRIYDGDWSSGAFLLCSKSLISNNSTLQINGLNDDSAQGDHAIVDFLHIMESDGDISYNCKDIPDIVPYMAVYAAYKSQPERAVRLLDVGRLKHKESDRIAAIMDYLQKIGVRYEFDGENLTVYGVNPDYLMAIDELSVTSYNDHRMAMTAFMLALGARKIIDIDDIDCMAKSFPMLPAIMKREFGI